MNCGIVYVFVCAMLLCCCGQRAPLGLSVLLCCFPAAQHFTGPQGGGAQGGLRTSGPRRAELVAPIVPQQTHPFGVLLSLHCQRGPQMSRRARCASPPRSCSSGSLALQRRRLQGRCTCCYKGKMDISALLYQQSLMLT